MGVRTAARSEIARVLVRLDHIARFIVNANHSIVRSAVKLCVADCCATCGKHGDLRTYFGQCSSLVLVFAPVANSDVSPIAVLGVPPVGSPQSTAKVAIAQKASYKPLKDVKGSGGVTGKSKPITGGTGTTDTTSTWRYVPKKNKS